MVLNEITYFQILGIPLIAYLGVITLLLFIATALLGYLGAGGKVKHKWHKRVAMLALALALVHGGLGILAYF